MKLAIISHTEHYKIEDGTLVGWGPTVLELNHLLKLFEEIYHVGVLCEEKAPKSSLPYLSKKIHFIPLKKVGGASFKHKWDVLAQLPNVLQKVAQTLAKVDCFQLRTPTGIGVYLIPYLTWFSTKPGWFKYAGNWQQKNAPLGFAVQRWMLKKQKRKVTINGKWDDQPKHCISFENPCLTKQNRTAGKHCLLENNLDKKLNFCFVGTFSKGKGIDIILEVLEQISHPKMGIFYFVGSGEQGERYKIKAKKIDVKIKFTGFLSKDKINEIYKISHFIVLPSSNEGFPKVIGEAMNYGCIPVVSDVSCIGQYIVHKENGFLISPLNAPTLLSILEDCMHIGIQPYNEMMKLNFNIAEKFTYNYYNEQLQSKILDFE